MTNTQYCLGMQSQKKIMRNCMKLVQICVQEKPCIMGNLVVLLVHTQVPVLLDWLISKHKQSKRGFLDFSGVLFFAYMEKPNRKEAIL